jgi:hypothetical protein
MKLQLRDRHLANLVQLKQEITKLCVDRIDILLYVKNQKA